MHSWDEHIASGSQTATIRWLMDQAKPVFQGFWDQMAETFDAIK
jgi:hypothetical protein